MSLKPSPATFQSLSNFVLAGMNSLRCYCYADIVIATAESRLTYSKRRRKLFQKLRECNLNALNNRVPYSHTA